MKRARQGESVSGIGRQKRLSKKRRIAEIMDCMHRRDAMYPEMRENDGAFASLIAIVWFFVADDRINPVEARLLKRLYTPRIKLRSDDIAFISERFTRLQMQQCHMDWLLSFLSTSLSSQDRTGLILKMWTLAYSDHKLCPTEMDVIELATGSLALTAREAEQLHEEGRNIASQRLTTTMQAQT